MAKVSKVYLLGPGVAELTPHEAVVPVNGRPSGPSVTAAAVRAGCRGRASVGYDSGPLRRGVCRAQAHHGVHDHGSFVLAGHG